MKRRLFAVVMVIIIVLASIVPAYAGPGNPPGLPPVPTSIVICQCDYTCECESGDDY